MGNVCDCVLLIGKPTYAIDCFYKDIDFIFVLGDTIYLITIKF